MSTFLDVLFTLLSFLFLLFKILVVVLKMVDGYNFREITHEGNTV